MFGLSFGIAVKVRIDFYDSVEKSIHLTRVSLRDVGRPVLIDRTECFFGGSLPSEYYKALDACPLSMSP
jgi:hypothetical protein